MSARTAAWAGIVLGVLAAYVALPPIMLRTPVVSLVLAAAGVAAGVYAAREGERRLGNIAVALAVFGAILAVVAVKSGEDNLDKVFVWSALTAGMLRFGTPLIFAAMGGIMSERSGVINIGLEGMMLMGAFFGIYGSDLTGSWVGGLAIAAAAGALTGLLHAFVSISLRADQVVSGTGINILALGVTGYVFIYHYGTQGTPAGRLARAGRDAAGRWRTSRSSATRSGTPTCSPGRRCILVPLLTLFLFRTRGGLRLRSVGEKPRAADTVGLPVIRTRYLAVIASGALAAHRRRVPVDRAARLVQREHDRGPRLHRARGGDLRRAGGPGARSPARSCSASRRRSPSGCRPSPSPRPCYSRHCHMS